MYGSYMFGYYFGRMLIPLIIAGIGTVLLYKKDSFGIGIMMLIASCAFSLISPILGLLCAIVTMAAGILKSK